ncbi:hypothetical protein KEM55_003996, partial [Ascosphaera atra]
KSFLSTIRGENPTRGDGEGGEKLGEEEEGDRADGMREDEDDEKEKAPEAVEGDPVAIITGVGELAGGDEAAVPPAGLKRKRNEEEETDEHDAKEAPETLHTRLRFRGPKLAE